MIAQLSTYAPPPWSIFGGQEDLTLGDRRLLGETFTRERVVLLRNFRVDSKLFVSFTSSLGDDFLSYEGGASERETIDDNPTLFSVSIPKYKGLLPLHGEMYYRAVSPRLLWFWCERPAETGGATNLADGVHLLETLRPETRRVFEEQRIKYLRFYRDEVWQGIFGTDDLDRVREVCRQGSVTMMVRYDDGKPTVCTEYACSAIISTGAGRQPAFINNILPVLGRERIGWTDSFVRMEDGSRIPEAIVQDLERAAAVCTFPVDWQEGDVLMIDNTRFLHGRAAFTGARSVCARMCRTPAGDLGFMPG